MMYGVGMTHSTHSRTHTVTTREARIGLGMLLEAVGNGHRVVITRHSEPVGELIRYRGEVPMASESTSEAP